MKLREANKLPVQHPEHGYILFLDDIREPDWIFKDTINNKWVTVRNYDEFVKTITEKGLPVIIAFDHDLGAEHYMPEIKVEDYKEKTGYDCAKWLVEYCSQNNLDLPQCFVHSFNPIGRENIARLLQSYIHIRLEPSSRKDSTLSE